MFRRSKIKITPRIPQSNPDRGNDRSKDLNSPGINNITLESVIETEPSPQSIPSSSVTQSVSPNLTNKPPSSSPTLISKENSITPPSSSISSSSTTTTSSTSTTSPITQSSTGGGKHSGEEGVGSESVSDPKSVTISNSNCVNIVDQIDVDPVNPSNSNNQEKDCTSDIGSGSCSVNLSIGDNETKRSRKRIKLTSEDLLNRNAITVYNLIYATFSRTKKKSLPETPGTNTVDSIEQVEVDTPEPVEDETPDQVEEDDTSEQGIIGPRVKVGPDGQLIIDEESLVIKKPKPTSTKTLEEVVTGKTTYASFRKRPPSARWSKAETIEFYTALNLIGPDFSLMSNIFFNGKRTRTDLKNKFRRENKLNQPVVEKALYEAAVEYCLAREAVDDQNSC